MRSPERAEQEVGEGWERPEAERELGAVAHRPIELFAVFPVEGVGALAGGVEAHGEGAALLDEGLRAKGGAGEDDLFRGPSAQQAGNFIFKVAHLYWKLAP